MNIRISGKLTMVILLAMLAGISTGCSSSTGPSLENIPHYPNAIKGEAMEMSGPGGFMGANIVQMTTTDSFDKVVDFYTHALREYKTGILSNTTELGRATAFSIEQKKGVISVAIQEFNKEGKVNITLMAAGR